jgi:hypothetical protein
MSAAVAHVFDPLEGQLPPRQRYELGDVGFREVPKKYRKFYRHWKGAGDKLAPNEVLCPVCKVVIRSSRELREGDKVYCMPCRACLTVARDDETGMLIGVPRY